MAMSAARGGMFGGVVGAAVGAGASPEGGGVAIVAFIASLAFAGATAGALMGGLDRISEAMEQFPTRLIQAPRQPPGDPGEWPK